MSIQKLRDSSEGMLSKVLIGLIIIVFGLFGFGSITTFLAPVPKVAEVNGEDITQQEMELAVERNRRLLQAQDQMPDEDQLRASVLQNLINRELLLQAAEDLGLYASDAVVDEEILATEVFQLDGVFSPDQFQLVIGSAGYSPVSYRAEMKNDLRLQQMVTGIQNSAFVTPDEARRASALAQQTRDIAWLRIDVDNLVDDVEVSEAEIEAYYNEHPGEFMTPETIDLNYVELRLTNLMDQVEVSEEELRQFYEETKALYTRDENRRVAHILIETNDDVTPDDARRRIEEIHQRLMEGEDFAELATELSQDPGSATEGGDLGFTGRGTFVEEFENVAWDLEVGETSQPVETEFGFHIIKLLDMEPAEVPEFADVRAEVEEAYREAEAESLFVEKSGSLSEIAFEASDLQEPAAALDLEIKSTGPVTRDATEGIAANEDVMAAAFSPDVLLDGNNSRLIEIDPNHHVVINVAEHNPPELQDLANVSDEVREILKRRKATELAAERAQEAVAMLENGSITRYVADQLGLEWQVVADAGRNAMGADREIGAEAFRLPRPPKGQKSVGWAQLSDGDAAVITVTRVQNKPMEEIREEELTNFARVLATQQGGYEYSEFRDDLRDQAEISRVN